MNKDKIIKMLEYSGLSYSDVQPELGQELLYSVNDSETDVCYHLRIQGNTLTIVFRGSDSKKDWSFNLDFCKKVIPYGNLKSPIKVHSGFINAYKSKNVRNTIMKFVTEKIKRIEITGHSYGAALAILCAVDLQYNFSNKDYEVMVFGCPRVGNNAFKKSYNKRLFKTLRIENRGDIVTKVPFFLMGYRHVGAKLLIGKARVLSISSMKKHLLQEYYSNIWDV